MGAYVDYSFYTEKYGGTSIPEKAFKRLAIDASFFIDSITFDQIKEPVIDEVKFATCAVAETIRKIEKNDGKSSESVGKHSVTYNTKGKPEQRQYSAAVKYLVHTGLMYRGIK